MKSAVFILLSDCILLRFEVRSLHFTLTIFNLIASKVEVKSKCVCTLYGYVTKLYRPPKNIQSYRRMENQEIQNPELER